MYRREPPHLYPWNLLDGFDPRGTEVPIRPTGSKGSVENPLYFSDDEGPVDPQTRTGAWIEELPRGAAAYRDSKPLYTGRPWQPPSSTSSQELWLQPREHHKHPYRRRLCCFFIIFLILIALGALIFTAVYFGLGSDESLSSTTDTPTTQFQTPRFRLLFTAKNLTFRPSLLNRQGEYFIEVSSELQQKLDDIFSKSSLQDYYSHNDIISYRDDNGQTQVDVYIYLTPNAYPSKDVMENDILGVLQAAVRNGDTEPFDFEAISVDDLLYDLSSSTAKPGTTETTPPQAALFSGELVIVNIACLPVHENFSSPEAEALAVEVGNSFDVLYKNEMPVPYNLTQIIRFECVNKSQASTVLRQKRETGADLNAQNDGGYYLKVYFLIVLKTVNEALSVTAQQVVNILDTEIKGNNDYLGVYQIKAATVAVEGVTSKVTEAPTTTTTAPPTTPAPPTAPVFLGEVVVEERNCTTALENISSPEAIQLALEIEKTFDQMYQSDPELKVTYNLTDVTGFVCVNDTYGENLTDTLLRKKRLFEDTYVPIGNRILVLFRVILVISEEAENVTEVKVQEVLTKRIASNNSTLGEDSQGESFVVKVTTIVIEELIITTTTTTTVATTPQLTTTEAATVPPVITTKKTTAVISTEAAATTTQAATSTETATTTPYGTSPTSTLPTEATTDLGLDTTTIPVEVTTDLGMGTTTFPGQATTDLELDTNDPPTTVVVKITTKSPTTTTDIIEVETKAPYDPDFIDDPAVEDLDLPLNAMNSEVVETQRRRRSAEDSESDVQDDAEDSIDDREAGELNELDELSLLDTVDSAAASMVVKTKRKMPSVVETASVGESVTASHTWTYARQIFEVGFENCYKSLISITRKRDAATNCRSITTFSQCTMSFIKGASKSGASPLDVDWAVLVNRKFIQHNFDDFNPIVCFVNTTSTNKIADDTLKYSTNENRRCTSPKFLLQKANSACNKHARDFTGSKNMADVFKSLNEMSDDTELYAGKHDLISQGLAGRRRKCNQFLSTLSSCVLEQFLEADCSPEAYYSTLIDATDAIQHAYGIDPSICVLVTPPRLTTDHRTSKQCHAVDVLNVIKESCRPHHGLIKNANTRNTQCSSFKQMLICAYRHARVRYGCSPLDVDTIAITNHRKLEVMYNTLSIVSCLIEKEKIPWLTFDIGPNKDASCDDIDFTYTISSKTCWKQMQTLIATPSVAGSSSLAGTYVGLGDRGIESNEVWMNQTGKCRQFLDGYASCVAQVSLYSGCTLQEYQTLLVDNSKWFESYFNLSPTECFLVTPDGDAGEDLESETVSRSESSQSVLKYKLRFTVEDVNSKFERIDEKELQLELDLIMVHSEIVKLYTKSRLSGHLHHILVTGKRKGKSGLSVTMTADVETSGDHLEREIPLILSRAALKKKLQIEVLVTSITGEVMT